MGSTNPSGLVIIFFYAKVSFLSTEWVDYVEEPMKYQVLRPQFFSMGGWGLVGWVGAGLGGGTHSVDMQPCGCFIPFVDVGKEEIHTYMQYEYDCLYGQDSKSRKSTQMSTI